MSFSEGKKMKVVDEVIIWCKYITCYVLLMSYMWAGWHDMLAAIDDFCNVSCNYSLQCL